MLTAPAIKLGGFLLAHALWIISELPPGDPYTPQALCEGSEGRELLVFEADTQEEAITKGKMFMDTALTRFDRCAFARDGVVTSDSVIDVVSVDIIDGKDRQTVVQAYAPAAEQPFRLLGNELVASHHAAGQATEIARTRQLLHEGAAEHRAAAQAWGELNRGRTMSGPFSLD